MKDLLVILVGLLLCGCSASEVQRTAMLVLPEKIAHSQDDAQIHPAVEITWDEDEPVAVDVAFDFIAPSAREAVAVVGSWRVYDAQDKEVSVDAAVGGGAEPLRGTVLIRKNRARLPFKPRHGNFLYDLKAGRYYAIALFSGSFRGRQVSFTTEKRWFEVTDASEKGPNQPPATVFTKQE